MLISVKKEEPQGQKIPLPESSKPAPADPKFIHTQAKELIYRERYAEAIGLLQECLSENPSDKKAIALLIRSYALNCDFDNAQKIFNRAVQAQIGGQDIYGAMVFACGVSREDGLFSTYLSNMVSKGYANEYALDSLITWFGKTGLITAARKIYDTAVVLKTDDTRIHSSMLFAYSDSIESAEAEKLFWTLVGKTPPEPSFFQALINCFKKAGDIPRAMKYFNIAMNLGIADEMLSRTMLYAYIDTGNPDGAAGFLLYLHRRGKCNVSLASMLIRSHETAGQLEEAQICFDFAVDNGYVDPDMVGHLVETCLPSNVQAASNIAIKAARKGVISLNSIVSITTKLYDECRFKEIIDFIDSLPDEAKVNPYVILRKAEALRKARRWEEAMSLVKEALEKNDLDDAQRNLAHTILAYSLKDSGQPFKAMVALFRLIDKIPPGSPQLARVLCGFVFAWEQAGFCPHIDKEARDRIASHLKSFDLGERSNLPRDIGCAIEILKSLDGKP